MIHNVQKKKKNKIFLARVSNKQNTIIDRPASSGDDGKYMKYVTFP